MKRIIWIIGVILILVGSLYFLFGKMGDSNSVAGVPKVIDYNFHVRPILSDKCFACHGPDENTREADLRLDTPEGAYALLKDSENRFAIVPGEIDNSELHNRIFSTDSSEMMPPPSFKLTLSAREKSILTKWIEQGAEYKRHWAFVKPELPEFPEISDPDWSSNKIDQFTLSKMDEMGLSPNPRADKESLLKRVSFDLTGLPPSIELQEEFLNDDSENAYEKVVDKLLASKHYGEKMAVHWLDVARYADSHGYQDDGLRTMWPWRDWVIHAFNENYSYDKFVKYQLAGDLIEEKNKETLLATGFNRNHKITQEGGVIDEEYRIEYVTDRTNTFGKAFLAMTFECAKCHDHKYDPISKYDYFGTFAFFNQVPEKGIVGTIDASFADPPKMKITDEIINNELPFINKRDSMDVEVMVMKDSVGLRNTHVLIRGAYDRPGDTVEFSTPKDILPFEEGEYSANREGLADWLFDPDHPLTSRVFVNRIWQEIFGRGIVKTAGDFGMQGEFPSHPELLDYLAIDFRESGWDIKGLVKKIVTSSTYTQSSEITDEKNSIDPENIFLSRSPRTRLTAELVRDHVLASSGLLNPEIGGPSMKPYQPEGLWSAATSGRGLLQSYIQDKGPDIYRRGLYTFIKRTVPPPSMLMFDASNRDQCEVRRLNTNTPLQALIMLNDPHVLEASRVLAENLVMEMDQKEEIIDKAFRKIICRKINDQESEILNNYWNETLADFKNDPALAEEFVKVGETPLNSEIEDFVELATCMQVIHTIYNMDEAITRS